MEDRGRPSTSDGSLHPLISRFPSMAAAARRIRGAPAAAQPDLPDEILEEIFLRLDAMADLARAFAACSCFHRVVSAPPFLRRFRSLHSPPILGILEGKRFVPADPPHRSAPAAAARALAGAADFTFSFLPDARSWRPRDCRDGRVLLSWRGADAMASDFLVVCDPLHRRYAMIPPIPGNLTVPIPQAAMKNLELFLAPAGEDEDGKLKDEEESSFRVFCTMRFENKFMAFFFSSANQKWGLITYHDSSYFGYRRWYAHGCIFWPVDSKSFVVMLDTREMKFSIIDLPHKLYDASNTAAVVELGKGRIGLLTLGNSTIACKILRNNGVGTEGWQDYKIIPLAKKDSNGFKYLWFIMSAAERYVSLLRSALRPEYFVLDLKTMLLEKLCLSKHIVGPAHLYASFPPPLAPPSL
ncbi:unnamed protein product [Urochloa humidicola]